MHKLANASLSPDLASRPFKFTSRQGRNRRTQLLTTALFLLREHSPEDISFADICKHAKIPRASAYHFFPNVEAIFHGIRLLHATTLIEKLDSLKTESPVNWKSYLERTIDIAVEVTISESAFSRLIYGYRITSPELRKIGENLDHKIAMLTKKRMEERYNMGYLNLSELVFATAFAIADSILKLSYHMFGEFTPTLISETKIATVAYLKNYLPSISD